MSLVNGNWSLPVAFYFQVQFHWEGQGVSGSFMEVSGLGQEIVMDKFPQSGNDGIKLQLPQEVKPGNIILKRPITPLDEKIVEWVNECFRFAIDGWISPCVLTVCLMDERQESLARWTCSHVIPVKWDLGTLNSMENKLVIETLTMNYNLLERTK